MTSKAQQRRAKRTASRQRRRMIAEAAWRNIIRNRAITLDDVSGRHLPGPWNYGIQADQDIEERCCPQCFRAYSDYENSAVTPCWECRSMAGAIPVDTRGGLPHEFCTESEVEPGTSMYGDLVPEESAVDRASRALVGAQRTLQKYYKRTKHLQDKDHLRKLRNEVKFCKKALKTAESRTRDWEERKFFQFLKSVDPEDVRIENHDILVSICERKEKAAQRAAEREREARLAKVAAETARREELAAEKARKRQAIEDRWCARLRKLNGTPETPPYAESAELHEYRKGWRKAATLFVLMLRVHQKITDDVCEFALQVIKSAPVRVSEVHLLNDHDVLVVFRDGSGRLGPESYVSVQCSEWDSYIFRFEDGDGEGTTVARLCGTGNIERSLTRHLGKRKRLKPRKHSGTKKC